MMENTIHRIIFLKRRKKFYTRKFSMEKSMRKTAPKTFFSFGKNYVLIRSGNHDDYGNEWVDL